MSLCEEHVNLKKKNPQTHTHTNCATLAYSKVCLCLESVIGVLLTRRANKIFTPLSLCHPGTITADSSPLFRLQHKGIKK